MWRIRSSAGRARVPLARLASSSANSGLDPDATSIDVPKHARCVIVGGGVIGLSTAYHLAKAGWNDIVLLEQSKLTSGTTWHAAGLVGTSRGTVVETRLSMVGTQLYEELENETGVAAGFRRSGSLTVARTADRMHALSRSAAKARSFGLTAEMVSPAEAGPGALVLFCMRPRAIAKHVGILTGPATFLHAYERLGVIEEPLTNAWRRRIAFAFLFPQR